MANPQTMPRPRATASRARSHLVRGAVAAAALAIEAAGRAVAARRAGTLRRGGAGWQSLVRQQHKQAGTAEAGKANQQRFGQVPARVRPAMLAMLGHEGLCL